MTETEFKKPRSNKTGENISSLLASCQIPAHIPDGLKELRAKQSQTTWPDGPSAINAIRNDLIHPKKAGHGGLAYEAWLLAQRYLELVIFRLCGYNGRFSDRTEPRYLVTNAVVPWASAE